MRVLLGGARVAERHPDALVVDPLQRVVHGVVFRDVVRPQNQALLCILLLRHGRLVLYEDLFEYLWGDCPEGGPLYKREIVARSVLRLRRALPDFVFTTRWGVGLNLVCQRQETMS